jgi:glucosamine--fructose-6-phosphate aminotransferase (isomerizing)
VVVVAMVTDADLRDKLLANLEEVKARGATTVALAHDGDAGILAVADFTLSLPATDPVISPLVDMVALQQLAYLLARERGLNVDRPRNLAKTVTVE